MSEEKEAPRKLSRKDFVKGAAAVAGAGALASCAPAATPAPAPTCPPAEECPPAGECAPCPDLGVPETWDEEADMLIIGAGGAGLMAAIEAHDKGAKVLLVEMQESPYWSESAMCGGCAGIPENPMQIAEGILDDSPDLLFEDMMRVGMYSNREDTLRLYTDNVGEAYERWTELGAEQLSLSLTGGHARKRTARYTNRDVTTVLYDHVKDRGIPILFNTRATRLVEDPTTGRVLGVEAQEVLTAPSEILPDFEGGEKTFLKGKVTVLASGGMCGSPEMYDRYVPRVAEAVLAAWAVPSETPGILRSAGEGSERPIGMGDGYIMGMAIGADTTHMYSITMYQGIPHPDYPGYACWFARPSFPSAQIGSIIVNKEGKRFIEEARSAPCEIGEGMLASTDKTMIKICDKTMWDTSTQSPDAQELIDAGKGYVWFGDTIEDLATKAGVDPAGLAATIEKWNSDVAQGVDSEFNRPAEFLAKIEQPPFVAHQNWLTPLHNSGGLRANDSLQILDVDGNVIPGLYGAGEIIGGDSGEVYLTCTHWPCAMTYGYLVGKKLAIEEALA